MVDRIRRTLVLLKPDTVKRGLIGEILSRFEKAGLKIVGLKMLKMRREDVERLYKVDKKWMERIGIRTLNSFMKNGYNVREVFGTEDPVEIGGKVREWLIDYLTSAPVVAVVLEGIGAVDVVRKIVGPTEPLNAPPGTIRGDYSHMSIAYANFHKIPIRNVVHASETIEDAEREIKIFFDENEIFEYERNIEEVIY